MIKNFNIEGLHGRFDAKPDRFHPDINIITGQNGAGKTTFIKTLWYAVSGNLERIAREVYFDYFSVNTEHFDLSVRADNTLSGGVLVIEYKDNDGYKRATVAAQSPDYGREIDAFNKRIIKTPGVTVFFPTFRRVEGGFTVPSEFRSMRSSRREKEPIAADSDYRASQRRSARYLQEGLNELSRRLSVGSHRFVASVSTDDLVLLLSAKHAEAYEETNNLHMKLSRFIQDTVGPPRGNNTPNINRQIASTDNATELLEEIRRKAADVTATSNDLLRPFDVLSNLICEVLEHSGIDLGGPLTLGLRNKAIASDALSAGEKQMLSFLCYNAFTERGTIFIDEPETSLHPDWQRILFPILMRQGAENQFIAATHSPFIYSKYADREIMLSQSRGDDDAR